MKISEILVLDCREKGNRKLLREKLKRLPLFANNIKEWNELRVEDLERVMKKVSSKYPIRIGYIMFNTMDDNMHYSIMIKRSDDHELLETIFAVSMFEGFAKSLIYMYTYIKNNLSENE